MVIRIQQPELVKKTHILQAAKYFRAQETYAPFHKSRAYDVLIQNGLFPPKAIVSKAHEIATGIALQPSEFAGARNGIWHNLLRELGFMVVEKGSNDALGVDVSNSLRGSREKRLNKLKAAEKKPLRSQSVWVKRYIRNADVVAERLYLAKGICEKCNTEAPFKRVLDGTPFLEVHHTVPLSYGGLDIVANTQALCPNCHSEIHDAMRLDRQFE